MKLKGFANDYVGKGMNGGKITLIRPRGMQEDRSVVMGNTCLFGATGGEFYGNGIAGERFAVRNSGCKAIVEGAGDHCCEYMTGGEVIVLGNVGHNFGAGMTGGFAYVLDEDRSFVDKCNKESVTFNRITNQEMEAHKSYLKDRIYCHLKETGSEVAQKILADFDKYQSKFWIVTPNAENLARIIKNTREEAA
jgi:glutamate synthase (NADPH/NADH) large chain